VQGDNRMPSGDTFSHFVASLLPGMGYPENTDELFHRNGTTTFAEALHHVCKKVKQLQCPDFPTELEDTTGRSASVLDQQSLCFVVNGFRIPNRFTGAYGQIANITGIGPMGAPGTAEPSFYLVLSKTGRLDLSRTIYLTECHAKMPLPSADN